jgi:hypothetical protein
MKPRSVTSASFLAAGALALVTLLVFFILQDYGPESSLRKFHEAIVQKDAQALNEVTTAPLADEDTKLAVNVVSSMLVSGNARYRLLMTDHQKGWIGAEVQYIYPNGQSRTIYWVVRKIGRDWKVDPTATRKVMSMPAGTGGRLVGFNTPR